ncbi:adenosylcobinamide-GDP ribazoletransferase [Maridesulfovibrio sp.]|uniref:adenosylcobinamide-GDP ribazoletransferase n=1 Tax=Maridesulfovibrio sp. TaxID=2795000 RepID=UPI002A18CE84|nr:adenosylcobinamide-GDP ribazoletransferase [Maridesulfovibrio sp.]
MSLLNTKGPIRDFLITLGFMTRIGPVMEIEAADLARTVKWMPLTGAVLGALIALPFYLGLFAGKFWLQAWLTVAASIYLTRGLHFDGIADIADGAGPYPDPERFWKIIKDSRCGVFGVLAAVLAVSGQILGFYYLYSACSYGAVIWVFTLGRLGNAAFGRLALHLARPGQGVLTMKGTDCFSLLCGLATVVIAGMFGVSSSTQILGFLISGAALFFLYRLAVKMKGANGDFLGAALVLTEISALLAFAALN